MARVESEVVRRARTLARIAHDGQLDKAGHPYIGHPAAVAALLDDVPQFAALSAADQEMARAAAWLHDVVEDTVTDLDDLTVMGFPPEVVTAVGLLTHAIDVEREVYVRAVTTDAIAYVVKLADNAHNSDPARLSVLDPATRARLIAKYEQDRIWLDVAG